MIEVTRLDGSTFILSADAIETVEATPETVIRSTTGRTYVVREAVGEVIERVVAYRRRIARGRWWGKG